MYTFPLAIQPLRDYHSGGRELGASRDGGARRHAGCDLIAPDGTEVDCVANAGRVMRSPYASHHGAFAIQVAYPNFTLRNGEIRAARGIGVGVAVQHGDLIGCVQHMHSDSMLHLEMCSGTDTGPLAVRTNQPYERRPDLVDPTSFLDGCLPHWVTTEFVSIFDGMEEPEY